MRSSASRMKLAEANLYANDAHDGSGGETATMTKKQLETTVDQHSFVLNGTPYSFRLRWAANEGRWSRRSLLAVDVASPALTGDDVVHVFVGRSTTPAELRRLLEDAVVLHQPSEVMAHTA